jgi:hypothetical protein
MTANQPIEVHTAVTGTFTGNYNLSKWRIVKYGVSSQSAWRNCHLPDTIAAPVSDVHRPTYTCYRVIYIRHPGHYDPDAAAIRAKPTTNWNVRRLASFGFVSVRDRKHPAHEELATTLTLHETDWCHWCKHSARHKIMDAEKKLCLPQITLTYRWNLAWW